MYLFSKKIMLVFYTDILKVLDFHKDKMEIQSIGASVWQQVSESGCREIVKDRQGFLE